VINQIPLNSGLKTV